MPGDQAAVALALDAAPADDVEELQLDLIGADAETQPVSQDTQKGRGRPAGSRNRRTVEMANFLLSRYSSPLEVLAQIATARVDKLKADIGCTRLEALQEKRLAAIALLPYLHAKMPVAVDVNTRVVHLNIFEPDEVVEADDGAGLTVEIVPRIGADE